MKKRVKRQVAEGVVVSQEPQIGDIPNVRQQQNKLWFLQIREYYTAVGTGEPQLQSVIQTILKNTSNQRSQKLKKTY